MSRFSMIVSIYSIFRLFQSSHHYFLNALPIMSVSHQIVVSLWPAVMDVSLLLSISFHFPPHAFIAPLMHLKLQERLTHHKNITPGQWHLNMFERHTCSLVSVTFQKHLNTGSTLMFASTLFMVLMLYEIYMICFLGCSKPLRVCLASFDLGI